MDATLGWVELAIKNSMLFLPPNLQSLIAELAIPDDLRELPPSNLLLQFIVHMAAEYRAFVPELNFQKNWSKLKARFAEQCKALKINNYITLYEHPENLIPLALNVSFLADYKEAITKTAIDRGFTDLLSKSIENAEPERVKALIKIVIEESISWAQEFGQAMDEIDTDSAEDYWKNIHPNLPIEEQRKVETDAQILTSVFLCGFHNAISIMAYSESLPSLVQRALSEGPDADIAMCKAVRVDNTLRQHPKFMERYIRATNDSDTSFLNRYNLTSSPLTNNIRFPGLYFLLSLLDAFGLLKQLTNSQILDLCDHARLDRWENRIVDTGNLAKRRAAFINHKFL